MFYLIFGVVKAIFHFYHYLRIMQILCKTQVNIIHLKTDNKVSQEVGK